MIRARVPAAAGASCRPRQVAGAAQRVGAAAVPLLLPRRAPAAPAAPLAPLAPARLPLLPPRAAAAGDAAGDAAAAQPPAQPPAKPAPKPRLPGLDSLRFFLIAYIGVGHFVSFATRDAFVLKLMTQINVWVGAFFVLSGYVAGYTATELNKYEAGARVKPAAAYTVARVAGFYPLFLLVNVLFGAMFIFADAAYNGGLATAFHGFLSATLTQAWFPAHAEIWNAPTWFLSALTFAMVALPHALPWVASLRRSGLVKLLLALTAASLIPKLAYSYDLNVWSILEGVTPPKAHPNQLLWNVTRFHPFYALLEVLIGVAAARLVMVDGGERALLSRWRSVCRVLRLVAAFHVVRRRLLLLLLLASFLILTNKRPNMPQHYTHTHKQTNTNKPTQTNQQSMTTASRAPRSPPRLRPRGPPPSASSR